MKHAIIAWERTPTNVALARAADWLLLNPVRALKVLRSGDVALARLDVRQSLDGIEVGMEALGELSARGVKILNDPSVLLSTHDKLLTARLLGGAGHPSSATRLATAVGPAREWSGPVVVKPRFGSWGNHVVRCESADELCVTPRVDRRLSLVPIRRARSCRIWCHRSGFDLRLVVARGRVVGAVIRVCARRRVANECRARRPARSGNAFARRRPARPRRGRRRERQLRRRRPAPGRRRQLDRPRDQRSRRADDDYSFVGDVFAAAAEALSDPRESSPRVHSVA